MGIRLLQKVNHRFPAITMPIVRAYIQSKLYRTPAPKNVAPSKNIFGNNGLEYQSTKISKTTGVIWLAGWRCEKEKMLIMTRIGFKKSIHFYWQVMNSIFN